MELLFYLAGIAMATHLASSGLLRHLLGADPIVYELYALPSSWLHRRDSAGFRLLRLKFSVPWVPAPSELGEWRLSVRILFLVARVSGATFPLLVLSFLAAAFRLSAH